MNIYDFHKVEKKKKKKINQNQPNQLVINR